MPGKAELPAVPAPLLCMAAAHHSLRHGPMFMVVCLLALLPSFCPGLLAGSGQEVLLPLAGRRQAATTSHQLRTYVVHLRKPRQLLSAGRAELETWHRSFLPTPTLDSGEPRMVYSYSTAISGFAAKLTPEEAAAMATKEGFLSARPDEDLVFETTWTQSYLRLTRVWNLTEFAKGIVVAVVDSGVNPGHAAFKDDHIPQPPAGWSGRCNLRGPNTCNNKLMGAMNFDSAGPTAEPLDKTGHGTFIAGVIGSNVVAGANVNGLADGNAIGVSPGVHLAVFRADTSSGLIASFDEAIRAGVDLIAVAMTLPARRFHKNDLAIASLAAVESGIPVICAAGNGGPHRSSVRNDAPWILTAGASTMDRALRVSMDLGGGEKSKGESLERPGSIPETQLSLVFPGAGDSMLKTCSAPLRDVARAAVLCESDPAVISPKEQGENVKNAMGAAMILLNNRRNGSTVVLEENVLPTVAVTYDEALRIVGYVQSAGGQATVTFKAEGTTYAGNPDPVVAAFSGRGPSTTNGGILKPDVIGPGVNVLGPSFQSSKGYVMMSGTSVSAAVLASTAAVLKKLNQLWTPAVIRSAIMTSSFDIDNGRTPIMDETGSAASAFATGAGEVHPNKAGDPGLVYDIDPEDYIRYLCSLPGYGRAEVDAVARRQVNCAGLGKLAAEELNYPSISVAMSGGRKTITRTVRNEGTGGAMYTAEVVGMPPEVAVAVNPDVLRFMSTGETASFTVSFNLRRGPGSRGEVYQGQLRWVDAAGLHVVRSPLVVTVA